LGSKRECENTMTWDDLRKLQRKLASWTEPWECEGHEVFTRVEEHASLRRAHLAWFSSQDLAALTCEMHNSMMYLINSLLMYRKIEGDKK